jgi:hypothetical protein
MCQQDFGFGLWRIYVSSYFLVAGFVKRIIFGLGKMSRFLGYS